MNDFDKRFIAVLRRDADLQEQGHPKEMGTDFDDIDRTLGPGNPLRELPWIFYDSWIDERNHDFPGYYKGITKSDWPYLARTLADSLEGNKMIGDERLIKNFSPRPSLLYRIKTFISGRP